MKVIIKTETRFLGNLRTEVTERIKNGKVFSTHKVAYIVKSNGNCKPIFKQDRLNAIETLKNSKCDRVINETLVRCSETNELISKERIDSKDRFNTLIVKAILSAHPKAQLINGYEKFNN